MSMSRLDQLLSRRHFVIGSSALAAATLSSGLWGCASDEPLGSTGPSDSPEENAADLVLYNGHVQTMVSESEVASAIAIAGNKIVYVGDDSGIDAFVGDTTQVIDLDGKFVSPGFIDGHIHAPGNWFTKLFQIDLTGLSTNEEYLEAIRSFVEAHPDEEGYIGSPFMLNAYQLPDGSNPGPSKEDLDAICPDKPILIHDVSYHAAWVNSKAFEMAGVTADTPDPEGGLFYRNEKGEPSGCVSDAAKGIVFAIMPDTMTNDNLEKALYKFMEEANSYGITGITNITQGGLDIIDMYHKVEREGNLTLRMRVVPTMKEGRTYDEVLSTIKSLQEKGSRVVLTSSFAPCELRNVDNSLVSRFCSGFLAGIEKPDASTRRRILQEKARQNNALLSDTVVDVLTERLTGDIRQLESCVHNLLLKAKLLGCTISVEMAQEILAQYSLDDPFVDVDSIIRKVCEGFGLSPEQLASRSRKQNLVVARNTIFYLARKHTELSLQDIGDKFSRRHSTVLKGIASVERELRRESPLGRQIAGTLALLERR